MDSLRDSESALQSSDVATFMVSLDPPEKNRAFAEAAGVGFPVLSDPEGTVARAYGVLAPSGDYALRWSFYIGPDGIVRRIDKQVNPSTHGSDALRSIDSLWPRPPSGH